MRGRCIQQYESVAKALHDPVSVSLFDEAGPYRADVDAILPDGTNLSHRLEVRRKQLAWLPNDDSIAEGPHAKASSIIKHSTGAKWAWMAATLRHKQNFVTASEARSGDEFQSD